MSASSCCLTSDFLDKLYAASEELRQQAEAIRSAPRHFYKPALEMCEEFHTFCEALLALDDGTTKPEDVLSYIAERDDVLLYVLQRCPWEALFSRSKDDRTYRSITFYFDGC